MKLENNEKKALNIMQTYSTKSYIEARIFNSWLFYQWQQFFIFSYWTEKTKEKIFEWILKSQNLTFSQAQKSLKKKFNI